MLQQTRVESVEKKFPEFIKRYKNFKSFKYSSEKELLRYWSGLGYYRRARNLWKAVKIINDKYGSKIPNDKEKLIKLPGVGKYTCASIRTIGFNLADEPVDINIYKIFTGLFGKVLSHKEIEFILINIWPKNQSRNFTEALMDISAQIRNKNFPISKNFNLKKFVYGKYQEDFYIPKAKKIKKKQIFINFYVFRFKNQIAFLKKPNLNFFKGFDHLPNSFDTFSKVINGKNYSKKIKKMNYIITNHEFKIDVYEVLLKIKIKEFKWKSLNNLDRIPLPTFYKKILSSIS